MAVTDVIIDKGATAADKGGMVFNVKAYGALGTALANPTQDDTAAFQATITAALLSMGTDSQTAQSARGSVVFVPHGVYRITNTLHLPSGVSLKGAGIRTTQLLFAIDQTGGAKDGLVWDLGSESPFRVGGFLEDIDLKCHTRDTLSTSVNDLVVVKQWTAFNLNRVRLIGARRYNLHLFNVVDITATHLTSYSAGTSNLYIGATEQGGSTTCRFVSSYFQDSQDGPGADVTGLGHTFEGCVFESAGARTASGGYGARVRWGTAAFLGPYFENNTNFDLIAGTEASTNTAVAAQHTAVTVVNPIISYNSVTKLSGAGGLRFERGAATVIGGNLGPTPHPLVFSQSMDHVTVLAKTFPGQPEVDGGGSVDQLPGLVVYTDPASGDQILTGRQGHRIGGGTLIRKHLSQTTSWTPGSVANGGTAATTVSFPGAQMGDTVVVSFNHGGQGLGARVLLFGSVGATGSVAVTLLNHYGSTINLGAGTLRIDIWQH